MLYCAVYCNGSELKSRIHYESLCHIAIKNRLLTETEQDLRQKGLFADQKVHTIKKKKKMKRE